MMPSIPTRVFLLLKLFPGKTASSSRGPEAREVLVVTRKAPLRACCMFMARLRTRSAKSTSAKIIHPRLLRGGFGGGTAITGGDAPRGGGGLRGGFLCRGQILSQFLRK